MLNEKLVKHCNERAVSTRIVMLAPLREEAFRSLHERTHHGYETTLRQILQFLVAALRADESACLKACETCDRDRVANPSLRAPLGHIPADKPFAALFIDIFGGQGSFLLGAFLKSILTMIDGLTGRAVALPIAESAPTCRARCLHRVDFDI